MTFAPRTWVVGEVVSAAIMNQEIRDQFNSMFDAWTTYTPTWTATTNPGLGNGIMTGRYLKVGRKCVVVVRLEMGSTTTYGSGGYNFGLPFAAAGGADYLGTARLVSAAAWNGQTVLSGGNSAFNCTFPAATADSRSATMSGTIPSTLAAGHILRAQIEYQTAS
ncbi:hypothetical protein ACFVAF_18265 [Streptomyces sp. NPDC057596]|uniref:hypothetical protein n=1 Tax=Streptomyces sp. NPDC057596 TaxID=3346178 RepID=UPI0036A86E52